VANPRHKRAKPRSRSQRLIRITLPVAAVATLATSAASTVVWQDEPEKTSNVVIPSRPQAMRAEVDPGDWQTRAQAISRSEERVTLEKKPKPEPEPDPVVKDHKFLTAPLNVWTGPGERFKLLDVLPFGTKVGVTGKAKNGYAEIVLDGEARWVNADYLADKKPKPEPKAEEKSEPQGLSTAACASGSDPESGLTSNAIAVHRAVCAEYPQIDEYGGVRPGDDGEHGSGHALDIMVYDDSATGDSVAEFVRANYKELGVSEIIWAQKIWTVERSSEGWRPMEDRGSTTANHYDHVHVTVS
jgi:hypothetical protein